MRVPSIQFAKGCAWRATYLYLGKGMGAWKIAYIALDPRGNAGSYPTLSGDVSITRKLFWSFRVNLPCIKWRYPMGPVRGWFYQMQMRILTRIDGRFRSWPK